MPWQWCVCVCVLYTVAAGSHVHMSGVVSCSALVGIFFLLFVLSYAHSAHNTIIYIMSGFVLKSVRTGSTANYTHTHKHTRGIRRAERKPDTRTNLQVFVRALFTFYGKCDSATFVTVASAVVSPAFFRVFAFISFFLRCTRTSAADHHSYS